MEIRPGTAADIPQIVSLLKASLGETFLPKSEGYWRWKHVDNPFGESPVLLATEANRLIGVRAFMRWRWSNINEAREAVRAVDTATHPSAQGKGIFTKLTMALLEDSEQKKIDLVFNTPNEKSMPGYLKMGWVKAGQMPIEVNAVRPVHMVIAAATGKKLDDPQHSKASIERFVSHPGLMELVMSHFAAFNSGDFVTAYSRDYLRWRYVDIPVAAYYAAGIEENSKLGGIFIYRVKNTRWGREFRVTDLFARDHARLRQLKKLISQEATKMNANFITGSGSGDNKLLPGILNYRTRNLGPIVTVRDIVPGRKEIFCEFRQWSPSLGDMELF